MKLDKMVSGKEVRFEISGHAFTRFIQRYNILNPDNQVNHITALKPFFEEFRKATKIKRISKTKLLRNEKYGEVPTYFRSGKLNFITRGNALVTVELNGELKKLNDRTARGLKKQHYYSIR